MCIMLQMGRRYRGPASVISRYSLGHEMYNWVTGTRDPQQTRSGVLVHDLESLADGPVKELVEEASSSCPAWRGA